MPYILAPPEHSLNPDELYAGQDSHKRLWTFNLEGLLGGGSLKQYTRSIYRYITSRVGYGIPPSRRLQIYIDKSEASPNEKAALLIQLVEGTTMVAENLFPLLQPLQYLRFRHHIHGFLSPKDKTQMFELLNAGDKLVESIGEAYEKVLAELIGGLGLRHDQVTRMRRLWLDIELRVEEFLTEKHLLQVKLQGVAIISSQMPWNLFKFFFFISLLCLAIWLGFKSIPNTEMVDDGETGF
ncbi:hypothetical protein DFP73DRAFT_634531 [Morchella snyderi]|nr:hypothetical protein DFP73DRAFT_634531 [Morchella snyderi]